MLGKAGSGGLMKQVQQIRKNIKEARAKSADTEVGGETGSGLVEVAMTCTHAVHKPEISEDLTKETADDKEMLEDSVLAAVSDASKKAKKTANRTMGAFTQGLSARMGGFFR